MDHYLLNLLEKNGSLPSQCVSPSAAYLLVHLVNTRLSYSERSHVSSDVKNISSSFERRQEEPVGPLVGSGFSWGRL